MSVHHSHSNKESSAIRVSTLQRKNKIAGVNTEDENWDRKLRLLGKLRIIKGPTGSDFRNHSLAAEQINKEACDWSHQTRKYSNKVIKWEAGYLTAVFVPFRLTIYRQPHHLAGLSPGHTHRQKNRVIPDVFGSWNWIEVLTQNLSIWQHITAWTVKWYWHIFMSFFLTWGCSGWHGNRSQISHLGLSITGAPMPTSRTGRHLCLHLPHCCLTCLQARNIMIPERLLFPLSWYWLQG